MTAHDDERAALAALGAAAGPGVRGRMKHYALVGPLKAVRMLLSGESVLVRNTRWEAVTRLLRYTRHHDNCAAVQTFGASCSCGLIDALLVVYGDAATAPR